MLQHLLLRYCVLQEPGINPGDVVFVLEEQDHGRFKRKGSDLIINMVIN